MSKFKVGDRVKLSNESSCIREDNGEGSIIDITHKQYRTTNKQIYYATLYFVKWDNDPHFIPCYPGIELNFPEYYAEFLTKIEDRMKNE